MANPEQYDAARSLRRKISEDATRKTVDEIFYWFVYVSIAKNRVYRKIYNVWNKSSIERMVGIGYNEFSAADGKQPPV